MGRVKGLRVDMFNDTSLVTFTDGANRPFWCAPNIGCALKYAEPEDVATKLVKQSSKAMVKGEDYDVLPHSDLLTIKRYAGWDIPPNSRSMTILYDTGLYHISILSDKRTKDKELMGASLRKFIKVVVLPKINNSEEEAPQEVAPAVQEVTPTVEGTTDVEPIIVAQPSVESKAAALLELVDRWRKSHVLTEPLAARYELKAAEIVLGEELTDLRELLSGERSAVELAHELETSVEEVADIVTSLGIKGLDYYCRAVDKPTSTKLGGILAYRFNKKGVDEIKREYRNRTMQFKSANKQKFGRRNDNE